MSHSCEPRARNLNPILLCAERGLTDAAASLRARLLNTAADLGVAS